MYLTDLADVLRRAGLKVVEIPGWKDRGRPGDFNPRGVLCHHTAGASDSRSYVDWMATEGRPDLSAPLAQLALSRTGIVYVMAAGRANHAGKAKAFADLPAGDGNEMYLGIEAMNTGFEGWAPPQYGAYVRVCAALNNAYGWPAKRTAGHKETSLSGKIDPGKMSMPDFRADVARDMAALGAPEEDEMADYAAQLNRIEGTVTAARQEANYSHIHAKAAHAKADAVSAALTALAAGLGPAVVKAVQDALAAEYEAKIELTKKETP